MKFLKLFLFFRFGHRKVFKNDVTGERILISKVVIEQASDNSKIKFSFIIYACCSNKTTK